MSRAEAREQALRALYAADQGEGAPEQLSARARRLVDGVVAQRSELDEALERTSDNWRVERMPVVDRNILRLALYELRNDPDTPAGVIISEAVRYAKRYSTERSGAFVNGVLGRLAKEERSD